jgi:hypothetical protein
MADSKPDSKPGPKPDPEPGGPGDRPTSTAGLMHSLSDTDDRLDEALDLLQRIESHCAVVQQYADNRIRWTIGTLHQLQSLIAKSTTR